MNTPENELSTGKLDSSGGVQSVDRAISVLEILARSGGAGVSAVAADIGVHKSTAFRLLGALEARGLVEQTHERGKYYLSFGVLRLASAIPGRLDLVRQGRAILDRLAGEFGETANLAVLRSHYVVNLDQAHGTAAVVALNWVAQLTPLHATSAGKVLLAYLEDDEAGFLLDTAGLVRFTDHTVTDRAVLAAQLAVVRADGHATAVDELEDGLSTIAVPVRDHSSTVVAALTISGPGYRLTAARMQEVLEELKAGATRISERLGYLG